MPRLIFRAAARRELAGIAASILRESGDRIAAENVVDQLIKHCEHIAALPGLLGRARPELGRDYRSVSFGNHVILMRYADQDGPRSHLYVVHIVDGRRDLGAYLSRQGPSR